MDMMMDAFWTEFCDMVHKNWCDVYFEILKNTEHVIYATEWATTLSLSQ